MQVGGRKQRSAVDSAMALAHDIDIGKRHKNTVTAVFMDVTGIYDNVSKDRLLETMRQLGLHPSLLAWVDCFMTKRTTALAFDGKREKMKEVRTGVLKGSPISPILFLIYLRPLFDQLE